MPGAATPPCWRLFVAMLALVAMTGAALAAGGGGGKQNGIYFRAFGGIAFQEESRINGTNVSDGNLEIDPAAGLGGAIGYRSSNLRLKGFGAWRHHDVDVFEALRLVSVHILCLHCYSVTTKQSQVTDTTRLFFSQALTTG